MTFYPKYYKLVSGIGFDKYSLTSFDKSLINAGIGNFNLVKVSSVLPIGCIKKDQINLPDGSILYAAFAVVSAQKGYVTTSISVSIPEDKKRCGLIFEVSRMDKDTLKAQESVLEMGLRAFQNRGINILRQEVSSITNKVYCEKDYVTSISAVVMW